MCWTTRLSNKRWVSTLRSLLEICKLCKYWSNFEHVQYNIQYITLMILILVLNVYWFAEGVIHVLWIISLDTTFCIQKTSLCFIKEIWDQTGFYSHLAILILCEHLRFLFLSIFFDNLFVLPNLIGIFCFPYVYDLSFRFLVCDVPSSVLAFLRVLLMHSLAHYVKPQLKHKYTFIDISV